MIRYSCPHCKKINAAADGAGGSITACTGCSQKLRVPQPPPKLAAPPPPTPEEIPVVFPEVVPEDVPVLAPVGVAPSPKSPPNGPPPPNPDALRNKLPADLPPEVAVLGEPLEFLNDGKAVTVLSVFGGAGLWALIFLCLSVAFILLSGFDKGRGPNSDPRGVSQFRGPDTLAVVLGVFLLGAATVGIGGVCGFLLHRARRTWTMVYSGGLLRSLAGKLAVWRWEDIRSVRVERIDRRTVDSSSGVELCRELREAFTIQHHCGDLYKHRTSVFPQGRNPFGEILLRETFLRMTPAIAAQLQNGATVDFLPFQISAAGVTFRQKFAPWAEVTSLFLRQGLFSINVAGHGRWSETPVAEVDNYHVLLPLLEKFTGKTL